MLQLLLGLVLFFGIHSVSVVALPLRDRLAAKSELGWKAFYSLISIIGLYLIIQGYADMKLNQTLLYVTPVWLKHLAALLLLPVFVLLFTPYFPGRISKAAKHPMLLAVKLWAVAHLLVNGSLSDVLLFGSFLVWAVVDRISMKSRPSRPVPGAPESQMNDIILIIGGGIVYVLIAGWGHKALFGIAPFG